MASLQPGRRWRSPWVDWSWIAFLLCVFELLDSYRTFVEHGLLPLWWLLYAAAIAGIGTPILFPFRDDRGRRKRLKPAGIFLTGLVLAFVGAFIFLLNPGTHPSFVPYTWASFIAFGVSFLLLIVVLVRAQEMVTDEPIRSITAAADGGFILSGAGAAHLSKEVLELPGATQLGDGNWRLPSTPETASALLRFAKKHHFEFESEKVNVGRA